MITERVPMEKIVSFKNQSGEKLAGTLHTPDAHSDRGVVLGHCFTCSRHTTILRRICIDLAQAGFMAIRFDFSGNGQSEGDFSKSTHSKQISEMKTAYDYIAARGASWIGMAGHSMGASTSLLAAARIDDVKAVCCMAGRLSGIEPSLILQQNMLDEMELKGHVLFKSRGRDLKLSKQFFSDAARFDFPDIISNLKTPMLIVHGDRDKIVSVEEAYKAHDRNPDGSELRIIPKADHMFGGPDHLQHTVSELVVGWFEKQWRHYQFSDKR